MSKKRKIDHISIYEALIRNIYNSDDGSISVVYQNNKRYKAPIIGFYGNQFRIYPLCNSLRIDRINYTIDTQISGSVNKRFCVDQISWLEAAKRMDKHRQVRRKILNDYLPRELSELILDFIDYHYLQIIKTDLRV